MRNPDDVHTVLEAAIAVTRTRKKISQFRVTRYPLLKVLPRSVIGSALSTQSINFGMFFAMYTAGSMTADS
jgi:hypothetical protein